ncbi:MAG: hypothetical protein ACR2PA_12370, partial [Hyphomicrobiaceae bacterium]
LAALPSKAAHLGKIRQRFRYSLSFEPVVLWLSSSVVGQLRTRAGAACSVWVIKSQSYKRTGPQVEVLHRTNDAVSTQPTSVVFRW